MIEDERFVVLGLARARTEWYSETARWASSGRIPIEFVKCLSASEIRARLAAGRAYSALLADAAATGVDRDLIDEVRAAGCAVVVVEGTQPKRDWIALGASATIETPFEPHTLCEVIARVAPRIAASTVSGARREAEHTTRAGLLIAVLSPGGTGGSTISMAIAQAAATASRGALSSVALLDASLRGDMALYHDIGDVVPGITELVEAHRGAALTPDATRELFFDIPERGYHLLLGLRRRRDWTALRARAFDAAIGAVRGAYEVVVADVDDDLDGSEATGSADMDDRNLAARHLTRAADLVVYVGAPGTKGAMSTVRGVGELIAHGVDPQRILLTINRGPRKLRGKAEFTRGLTELLTPMLSGTELALAPVFVPESSRLEAAHHYATALPSSMVRPLGAAVRAALASGPRVQRPSDDGPEDAPHDGSRADSSRLAVS